MADEKNVREAPKKAVAKTNPSRWDRFVNWIKTLPQRIAKPFRNMWHELKRVTWPTKRKLMVYSCVVLLFMLFMGVVIGLFDLGASALVKVLGNIQA